MRLCSFMAGDKVIAQNVYMIDDIDARQWYWDVYNRHLWQDGVHLVWHDKESIVNPKDMNVNEKVPNFYMWVQIGGYAQLEINTAPQVPDSWIKITASQAARNFTQHIINHKMGHWLKLVNEKEIKETTMHIEEIKGLIELHQTRLATLRTKLNNLMGTRM